MSTPEETEAPIEPVESSRPRRWPLGVLTLLVLGVIGIGLLLFGDEDETTTSITVPRLAEGFDLRVGETAPDFAIELLDGGQFQLSKHLAEDGRPVILNLWASWCGPCRAEMPALDAAAARHTDVYFLGVAVIDDPAAAAEFAAEIGVSYPLAIDDADRVSRRYPSPGLPATFMITSEGIIVRTVFGQVNENQLEAVIAEDFGL